MGGMLRRFSGYSLSLSLCVLTLAWLSWYYSDGEPLPRLNARQGDGYSVDVPLGRRAIASRTGHRNLTRLLLRVYNKQ